MKTYKMIPTCVCVKLCRLLFTKQENVQRHNKRQCIVEVDQYAELRHKACLGLLWYMEWKRCKASQKQWEMDLDSGTRVMCYSDACSVL